jgi:hypothetical protein
MMMPMPSISSKTVTRIKGIAACLLFISSPSVVSVARKRNANVFIESLGQRRNYFNTEIAVCVRTGSGSDRVRKEKRKQAKVQRRPTFSFLPFTWGSHPVATAPVLTLFSVLSWCSLRPLW